MGWKFYQSLKADSYERKECIEQWYFLPHNRQLVELLCSETEFHALVAHNDHKNEKISQEGGTGILLFDTIYRIGLRVLC